MQLQYEKKLLTKTEALKKELLTNLQTDLEC